MDVELGAGLRPHPADPIREGVPPVAFKQAIDRGVSFRDPDDSTLLWLEAVLVRRFPSDLMEEGGTDPQVVLGHVLGSLGEFFIGDVHDDRVFHEVCLVLRVIVHRRIPAGDQVFPNAQTLPGTSRCRPAP